MIDWATPWALKIVTAPSGISSSSSTKTAPLRFERLDHMAIVDDLVADIDRRAEFLERPLDDVDRPHDAGAETSGLSHKNPHPDQFLPQGQSRQTICWVALPEVQRQTRHGGPIDEQAS